MKMKILLISHQSNKSGAPRFLLNVLPKLNESFRVLVLLNKYQEAAHEFKEKAETIYFPLESMKIIRHILNSINLFDKLKLFWFRLLLMIKRPDLIYINTAGNNIFSKYLALQNKSLKYILHVHESEVFFSNHPNPDVLRQLIENAELVIGCSEYITNMLDDAYKLKNAITIYEGVNTERFKSTASFIFKNKYLSGLHFEKLVGVTGSPQHRKATDVFIEAAILFNKKNQNNKFLFVWLGGNEKSKNNEFYQYCQNLITNSGFKNILLLEQIDEVHAFYNDLDLFVIPSREDPFPLSMLEAMYFKVPVIGSRVSGIPEALGNNCGKLFDSENVIQLCSLFESFENDKKSFDTYARNAYEKFSNNYDIKVVGSKLVESIKGHISLSN